MNIQKVYAKSFTQEDLAYIARCIDKKSIIHIYTQPAVNTRGHVWRGHIRISSTNRSEIDDINRIVYHKTKFVLVYNNKKNKGISYFINLDGPVLDYLLPHIVLKNTLKQKQLDVLCAFRKTINLLNNDPLSNSLNTYRITLKEKLQELKRRVTWKHKTT